MQIGIGSGYYTAILAELVGRAGRVEAYEIEERLAAIASGNLAHLSQVTVRAASAVGTTLPGADLVYVAAGAAAPDPGWLRCLRPRGRLVMPWQPMPRQGRTLRVTRVRAGFAVRLHGDVSFVGCVGADSRDVPMRAAPARPIGETRSLHVTADTPPDDSATAIYPQVWFSATGP